MSERRWYESKRSELGPKTESDPTDRSAAQRTPPVEPDRAGPLEPQANETQRKTADLAKQNGPGLDTAPERPLLDQDAGKENRQMEESLDNALSSLERMLDRQPELPFGLPEHDLESEEPERDAAHLPVLDNIVVPGRVQSATAPLSELDIEAPNEAVLRRRIAARLASEIDIIVQARLEAALEQLHEQIRKRVADHIDIMLPEIVDELYRCREPLRKDD